VFIPKIDDINSLRKLVAEKKHLESSGGGSKANLRRQNGLLPENNRHSMYQGSSDLLSEENLHRLVAMPVKVSTALKRSVTQMKRRVTIQLGKRASILRGQGGIPFA